MPINNHKQSRCKRQYSCDNFPELEQLNSQVCEQQFFLLSQFKHIVNNMSKFHFSSFFIVMFDLMNEKNKNILINKLVKKQILKLDEFLLVLIQKQILKRIQDLIKRVILTMIG